MRSLSEVNSWTVVWLLHKFITARLTFLAHLVHMRPNFQGILWFECDGLREDELLIRFLLN